MENSLAIPDNGTNALIISGIARGGHRRADHVAELAVPEEITKLGAQRVHLLAVGHGQGIIVQTALEVVRLIADHIAVEQALVDHIAVVETGHRSHELSMREHVAAEWDVLLILAAVVRKLVSLHLPIVAGFAGEEEVGAHRL